MDVGYHIRQSKCGPFPSLKKVLLDNTDLDYQRVMERSLQWGHEEMRLTLGTLYPLVLICVVVNMEGRLQQTYLGKTTRDQTPSVIMSRPLHQVKNPCQLRCLLKAKSTWNKWWRSEVIHASQGIQPVFSTHFFFLALPCIYFNEFLLYFPLIH